MFSKEEEQGWTEWLIEQMTSGSLVLRLEIMGDGAQYRVQAMAAYGLVVPNRSLAGIILFNSESESVSKHTGDDIPSPLKCSIFEGDPESWKAPDMIPDDCYQREWMRQTATLCLYREELGRRRRAISPGSFLALRYLGPFQGAIYEAYATAESEQSELVLGMIEALLRELIGSKYAELAALTAGMNQS